MYSHVLIVGGTGMLLGASKVLAARSRHLTSIARTEDSLQRLDAEIARAECVHHMHALDWSQPATFVRAIADRVREVGDPELVLAWLHDDRVGPLLANAIAPARGHCDFYQIRGSAAANPAANIESPPFAQSVPGNIDFHQIVLGFRIEGGGSRWLHDDEISAGVLAAMEGGKVVAVVGTVEPWSRRPNG
ncbi:MAG: hypothetical protein ACREP2_05815 [Rhodanobacteraceae bacterium]